MILIAEKIKPAQADTCMSALEFLHAEKEFSQWMGVTAPQFFEYAEKWKAKSDEERQLCYMDFAERYADYVCGFEKKHSKSLGTQIYKPQQKGE
jgi:hypothetical protein